MALEEKRKYNVIQYTYFKYILLTKHLKDIGLRFVFSITKQQINYISKKKKITFEYIC